MLKKSDHQLAVESGSEKKKNTTKRGEKEIPTTVRKAHTKLGPLPIILGKSQGEDKRRPMSERVTIYPEEMTQRASEFPREWEFNQVQAQLLKEFPMTAVAAWTAIQRTKRIDDKITRIPIRKR